MARRSIKRASADRGMHGSPLKRMSLESWTSADHVGDSVECARYNP